MTGAGGPLWLCVASMQRDGKPRPSSLPFHGNVMLQDMSVPSLSCMFLCFFMGWPLLFQYASYCSFSYLTSVLLHVSLFLPFHIHIPPSSFLNDILNSKINLIFSLRPLANKMHVCSFEWRLYNKSLLSLEPLFSRVAIAHQITSMTSLLLSLFLGRFS